MAGKFITDEEMAKLEASQSPTKKKFISDEEMAVLDKHLDTTPKAEPLIPSIEPYTASSVENIPQAVGKYGANFGIGVANTGIGMANAVASPVQTAQGIEGGVRGMVNKAEKTAEDLPLLAGSKKSVSEMIPEPIKKILRGTIAPVLKQAIMQMSPVAQAVYLTKKGIDMTGFKKLKDQDADKVASAMLKDFTDRYGGAGLKVALEKHFEDPTRVVQDIIGIATAGETAGLTTPLAKASMMAKTLEAADVVTNPVAAVGKIGGIIAKKALSPFAKEAMPDIMKLAEKYGIELPASSMTKSRAVPLTEAKASKSMYGQDITDLVEKANYKIKAIADNVVENAGKQTETLALGKTIDEGLKNFRKTFYETKGELYNAAKLEGVTNATPMTKTIKSIQEILETKQLSLAKEDELIKELRKLQGRMNEKNGIPMNMAKATWQDIKNKVQWGGDTVKTGDNAVWSKVSAAMSEDIDDTLKVVRPDLKEAITTANTYYKDNINLLNSKWGKAIYNNSGKPDLIVKSILAKDMSTVDIPSFMNSIGKDASESIRVATLKDIFEGSTSATTGTFTGSGIAKKLANNADKYKSILTPQQYSVVQDISDLSSAMSKGDKIAHGSQTAFLTNKIPDLIAAIGGATAGASHGVAGAGLGAAAATVVSILGQAAWNKFISSPAGRKWLTVGYSVPGQAGQFKNAMSRLVSTSKIPQEDKEAEKRKIMENAISATKE